MDVGSIGGSTSRGELLCLTYRSMPSWVYFLGFDNRNSDGTIVEDSPRTYSHCPPLSEPVFFGEMAVPKTKTLSR